MNPWGAILGLASLVAGGVVGDVLRARRRARARRSIAAVNAYARHRDALRAAVSTEAR